MGSLTLLCSLGYWQLSRAKQKNFLLAQAQQAKDLHPLSAQSLLSQKQTNSLRYRPVLLTGKLQNDKAILLDNKIYNKQIGYLVYVPLALDPNTVILINRGWIPLGSSRKDLPKLPPIAADKEVIMEGTLEIPEFNRFISTAFDFDLNSNAVQWPLRVQQLELSALANFIGKTVYPMSVTLNRNSPYIFTFLDPKSTISPDRHIGYAVQWFGLATALFGFYSYIFFWRRHEFNNQV